MACPGVSVPEMRSHVLAGRRGDLDVCARRPGGEGEDHRDNYQPERTHGPMVVAAAAARKRLLHARRAVRLSCR